MPNKSAAHDILLTDLVITVMPALTKAVYDAARDVAMQRGNEEDTFAIDEAASEILREVAGFILQCTVEADDEGLVHPRQMTEEHFKAYWNVE